MNTSKDFPVMLSPRGGTSGVQNMQIFKMTLTCVPSVPTVSISIGSLKVPLLYILANILYHTCTIFANFLSMK